MNLIVTPCPKYVHNEPFAYLSRLSNFHVVRGYAIFGITGKPLSLIHIPTPSHRMLDPELHTGTADGGGNGTALNIYTREVEVLVLVGVAAARELEDAEVPVLAVGRGGGRHGRDHLLQRLAPFRVPEADRGSAAELLAPGSGPISQTFIGYPQHMFVLFHHHGTTLFGQL